MSGTRGAGNFVVILGLAALALAAGAGAYFAQPQPRTEFVIVSFTAQGGYAADVAVKVNGKLWEGKPVDIEPGMSSMASRDVSDLTIPGENKLTIEIRAREQPTPKDAKPVSIRLNVQHVKRGEMLDTSGGPADLVAVEREIEQPAPGTPVVIEATFQAPASIAGKKQGAP